MGCLPCLVQCKPSTRDVFLINQNGKLIKAKQGTLVEHILASHPNHIGLQGTLSSETSIPMMVLPDSFRLGCGDDNEIYFLVTKEQVSSNPETSMRLAHYRTESGEDNSDHRSGDHKKRQTSNPSYKLGNEKQRQQLTNASLEHNRWEPAQHSTPEMLSPKNL